MNSRELTKRIFARKGNGVNAVWVGWIAPETVPVYAEKLGLPTSKEAIDEIAAHAYAMD